MIFVVRESSSTPRVLKNNALSWTNELINSINQYDINSTPENKKIKDNTEKKYNHPEVRQALKVMFHGKCAYCESYVLNVSYPHIEHFVPKSLKPKLCFSWGNLLLSCGICNGIEFKGNKFPTKAQNGPYVNPTIENPDDYFEFIFDHKVGVATVKPKNKRGETTEIELGLNRKELVKDRSELISKVAFIALKASEGDQKAKDILNECCQKKSEYSAFSIAIAKHLKLYL